MAGRVGEQRAVGSDCKEQIVGFEQRSVVSGIAQGVENPVDERKLVEKHNRAAKRLLNG